MVQPSQRSTSHAYAWVVVLASCLLLAVAFGLQISISVFLRPLEAQFGWDRAVTSFAYSSASFMTGVMGVVMGRLVDRVSPRPIVLAGAVATGAGLLLLAGLHTEWQLYAIYGLLIGGLGAGCFLIPLLTNVGFWFDRHKGLAIGALMAGQSLGGAFMPALSRGLLGHFAWRETYALLGVGAWAVLIPLALLVRPPPGLTALKAPAGATASSPHTLAPLRITTLLSMAIVCCCVCMSIPILHVFPLAVEKGIAPEQAALVLGTLMTVSIAGRIGIGTVADSVGGVRALLLASGVQTAMVFWFSQTTTLPGLLLIGVLFGLGYGGVIPSYAIIIRELIPPGQAGFSMGVVFFFGNLGMALGGYLGGVFYDLSGAYPLSFAVAALAGLANLAIVGTLLMTLRARQTPLPLAS